jgi:hypothetical protein
MSDYAERFAENDIDFTILGDLTDQELEKIGVASLGHRRKLLRAIADLKVVEKSAPTVAVAAKAPAGPHPPDSAERRQVTVMFSDLVGSTALSARMDPEDLREVISAYQKCVAETVRRFDGFVAKYMGDGVLVYFGYPQAHEDDAERAVRAGLELIAAVGALRSPVSLQTRVGIATGLVVVGDLIGSGEAQERVAWNRLLAPKLSCHSHINAHTALRNSSGGLQDSFWAAVLTWRWRRSISRRRPRHSQVRGQLHHDPIATAGRGGRARGQRGYGICAGTLASLSPAQFTPWPRAASIRSLSAVIPTAPRTTLSPTT